MLRTALLVLVLLLPFSSPILAQDESAIDRLNAATRNLNQQQKVLLEYRFKPGDEMRWKVEHTASTKTQIAGTMEETSSRSQSTKLWKVTDVDSKGNMQFVHSVEQVEMWQKIGEDDPITFNSESDEFAPDEFAGLIGTIRIHAKGG